MGDSKDEWCAACGRPVVQAPPDPVVDHDLKRLITQVRESIAALRATRSPDRYVISLEETCIEMLAETMQIVCGRVDALDRRLVVCERIEALDRRLRSLETSEPT